MWTSKLSKLHVTDVDKEAGKDASVAGVVRECGMTDQDVERRLA